MVGGGRARLRGDARSTASSAWSLTLVVSIAYQATAILLPPAPRRRRRARAPTGRANGCAARRPSPSSTRRSTSPPSPTCWCSPSSCSPAEIAIYFAATRIIQVVNLVPYAATVGTAHLFSASHTRGDHDELQRLCRHVVGDDVRSSPRSARRHHRRRRRLAARHVRRRLRGRLHAARHPRRRRDGARRRRPGRGHAEHDRPRRRLRLDLSRRSSSVNVALAVALIIPFGVNGAAVASAISLALRAVWLSLRGAPAARRRHVDLRASPSSRGSRPLAVGTAHAPAE